MPNIADTNNMRRVVTLHYACHDFLLNLFQRAAEAGLVHPSEMVVAGHTWNEITQAQEVQLSVPSMEPPPAANQGAVDSSQTEPSSVNASKPELQP